MLITKAALHSLHTSVIYILGGPSDIAYTNGMDDYERINSLPVVVANLDVGHGGTFMKPNGGREASVAISWLDWLIEGRCACRPALPRTGLRPLQGRRSEGCQ